MPTIKNKKMQWSSFRHLTRWLFVLLVFGIFAINKKMDMGYIKRIQKLCASPMRGLGYNFLANMKERDNDSIPIVIKDRHEVWPLYYIL